MDKDTYKILRKIYKHGAVTADELFSLIGEDQNQEYHSLRYDSVMQYLDVGYQLQENSKKSIYYIRTEHRAYIEDRHSQYCHNLRLEILAVITALATTGTFLASIF